MSFFKAIKALFPFSRAFNLTYDSNKRKFMQAIAVLPKDVRRQAELAFFDLFPYTTRAILKWSDIFAIIISAREKIKQRDIIQMCWRLHLKGQSAAFMEYILQHLDPAIRVIENIPASDPKAVRIVRIAVCNYRTMVCGNKHAVCDMRLGTIQSVPTILRNDVSELYTLPDDRRFWEFCFFVCKNITKIGNRIVYIERLKMDIIWKNFIEFIILKMKPVHTTAVLYIEWQGGNNND